MAQSTSNYDHLRRKNSKHTNNLFNNTSGIYNTTNGRTPTDRVSNDSVDSASYQHNTSTGRNSAVTNHTNVTEPAVYSKKFVVVGDGGCGKTSLLISYAEGRFPEKYVPTVFENYITTTSHPPTGKLIELALWDTAGQEEYDRLRPLSYPETDLLFVCFAIDCPNSLENIMDKWYPEVLHFCPTTPLILCGLKSDLRQNRRCIELLKTQGLTPVTYQQGAAVAEKMSAMYMECSAKEQIGVEQIFDTAICTAVEREEQEKAFLRGERNVVPVRQEKVGTGTDTGGNVVVGEGRPTNGGGFGGAKSKKAGRGRRRDKPGCVIL